MARVVGGLGCSHAPSIAHAYDRGMTEEPHWRPLFEAFRHAQRWLLDIAPDALVVVYNDHVDQFFFDCWPTFAIGLAQEFEVADEGYGPRAFPPVPGHPALARHLASFLVQSEGFDLALCEKMVLDHGVLSALPLVDPDWRVPVVPLAVNVVRPPLPTPARCWALGQALARALAAYPEELRVVMVGTGGLSHQLTGPNFGEVRPEWDRRFLELIDRSPQELTGLSMDDLARLGGDHSVEVVQWMVMRAALPTGASLDFQFYYPFMIMGYAVAGWRAP